MSNAITIAEVADILGVTVATARKVLKDYGVESIGTAPPEGRGRPPSLYELADVKEVAKQYAA